MSATSPTTADRICPPTSARGRAGAASGEPVTRTIEVANGIYSSGNLVCIDNKHMTPIATEPPAAPAAISNHLCLVCIRLSLACGYQLADQGATEMPESQALHQNKKRRP